MEQSTDREGEATRSPAKSPKWAEMTPREKALFLLKLAISIISFGFIFPTLTSE